MRAPRLKTLFEGWLHRRLPRRPGPVTLSRRRLFILPTRFGYGYLFLVALVVLGATNYSNSMAFALAFLLAGIGLVAMYHTHANLAGLEIDVAAPEPGFAGQDACFELRLINPSPRARYVLRAKLPGAPAAAAIDIPARASARTRLRIAASRRGWLPLPRFTLASEFPLGLFHAWAWIELDVRALVCPRPLGTAALPIQGGAHNGADNGTRPGVEEFVGLRAYRVGDPIRWMHWKSLARLAAPQVKEFTAASGNELWLAWDALPHLDTEARLSQLTRWLLVADGQHRAYGLQLPDLHRLPARDAAHRRACLQALALYGLDRT